MKKIVSGMIISFLLVFSGCGTESAAVSEQDNIVPQNTSETEEKTDPVPSETPAQAEEDSSSDILVLYFSRTGEQYNVGMIDHGNTAIVAEMIAAETGADMFEILPADDQYPVTYEALTEVAKQEQNDKARPAYLGELPDLNQYEFIFIGAPVWWGDWPMIMYTVFENNDFSGKRLLPFSTHEGSGLSGFGQKLQDVCPDAEVLEGMAIRGSDAQNKADQVRDSVTEWITNQSVH